jgi:hypothetical protein
VNAWPPTVTSAVLEPVAVFASTVKLMLVDPLPLGVPTVTQAAPLVAVHAQPPGVSTVIVPAPPDSVKDWLAGDNV